MLSLVCSVEEDQVAGLGGANGNFGRLKVTNLADEHNVRVVPQDRAQAAGKGQADLLADLDLHGAFELIFDGVFKRDDLAPFVVGLSQRGVEGSGLAAASGAGQQHEALRQLRQLSQDRFLIRLHAELTKVKVEALAAKNAQTDRLPVFGGDDRDAQVIFLLARLHGDATVVSQPLFGNIQARHDLEPRHDRRVQVTHVRRHGHRFQHSVHAIPKADGVGVGFQMDVRRAEAEGFLQDLVHESRYCGFERGIGCFALHVKDDLLVELYARRAPRAVSGSSRRRARSSS